MVEAQGAQTLDRRTLLAAAGGQRRGRPDRFTSRILGDPKARLNLVDRNEIDVSVLVPVPWLEATRPQNRVVPM
jgi:hypothetical protein